MKAQLLLAILLCAGIAAHAQTPGAVTTSSAAAAQIASDPIRQYIAEHAGATVVNLGAGARVEVEVGALSSRLQLAACQSVEPFIPANARLWGRSHIGVRCADTGPGAVRWQVYLPVHVKVFGPALVATRPVAAGQTLSAEDVTVSEVEWTREAQGVVTDPAQLDGRVLTRPIAPGQPIGLAALRAAQVLAAGDLVKVVGIGAGFSISAQAVALSAAQDGQTIRVRLDSGRILTGVARGNRQVQVTF